MPLSCHTLLYQESLVIRLLEEPPKGEEIRELTPDEIEGYVRPQYALTGNVVPDPSVCTFIGIVRGGEVIAFLGLQIKLHSQPLWIKEGESARFTSLVHKAEEIILKKCGPQWVYLFCPPGRLVELAKHMDMTQEPWVVMSKLVMPPVPLKFEPIDLSPPDEVYEGIVQ
jgi:hypothetical protein